MSIGGTVEKRNGRFISGCCGGGGKSSGKRISDPSGSQRKLPRYRRGPVNYSVTVRHRTRRGYRVGLIEVYAHSKWGAMNEARRRLPWDAVVMFARKI